MKMPHSHSCAKADLRGMAVPAMTEFIYSPRAGRPCHESRFSGETRRITKGYVVEFKAMPELPDVVVYIESLQSRVVGKLLQRIRLASPFLLRSVQPTTRDVENTRVLGLRRLGKRI